MQWDILSKKIVLKTIPFQVEEVNFRDKHKDEIVHPYHRLICPDWVNVLPVTKDGEAVLIYQSRAGTLDDVLETPGGAIDQHEKDSTMAAARELEEETGYTSQRIMSLGCINPNPAINDNRLHMFVALACELPQTRKHFPDTGEFIRIEKVPVAELETLVRHGRINSALSALTIMLALKYLKS